MNRSEDSRKNLRRKNWMLFALILTFMILLYALSFVRFGEVVYS